MIKSFDRGYSKNATLNQIITSDQLQTIIGNWNDNRFYTRQGS